MDLALCTAAQSCWNRKLSKLSWYAEAFRVPFTGTKGPSPATEKQPHTIIPLHQTLHLTQCSQTSTVLLATANPRLVHQIARWRSAIRHSRERVSTALESSGGVLYTTALDALHCTWWCMAWMQPLVHGNPFHEALYALFLCQSEGHMKFGGLYRFTLQKVGDLCALCASASTDSALSFSWPRTLWLSCCRSQLLPLCDNITDCWLWII